MKTALVLATVVAMLHAKSYKMETHSSGSLIARLIKDDLYHKHLENQRFYRTQVLKKGSQPIMNHHDNFYLANITVGTPDELSLSYVILRKPMTVFFCQLKTIAEHFCNEHLERKPLEQFFFSFEIPSDQYHINVGLAKETSVLGQTVSLMIDTSSSNLWVIDAACNTDVCNGRFDVPYTRHKFDSTKSSTFSTTNNTIFIPNKYGSCTGILVNDTVSFAGNSLVRYQLNDDIKLKGLIHQMGIDRLFLANNSAVKQLISWKRIRFKLQNWKVVADISNSGLTIDQQEFANVASMDGYLPTSPLDGIFGLGWPVVASGEVTPPMQNILPNLDAPLFTIWMDRRAASKAAGSPGLITYGAIDTTNCQSGVNYVPLSSEAYWQFNIEGFSVGSFSESRSGQVSADTSMSWIGAPGYIVDAVVSQTGAQFDIMYGFFKVDCSTMKTQPDLVFSINGFKYNIPPKEYLFDYGIEKGQCVLGLYSTNSGGFGTTWTFGNPWLRTFCNIFDIGGKRIGFAKANHSKS
uniref:Peptidase A1 domain-containing protein n=1 Tax=Angiostrongylus cantonensis TaxID=6313 RepID=A0A0K0DFK4_ANGCA